MSKFSEKSFKSNDEVKSLKKFSLKSFDTNNIGIKNL